MKPRIVPVIVSVPVSVSYGKAFDVAMQGRGQRLFELTVVELSSRNRV